MKRTTLFKALLLVVTFVTTNATFALDALVQTQESTITAQTPRGAGRRAGRRASRRHGRRDEDYNNSDS